MEFNFHPYQHKRVSYIHQSLLKDPLVAPKQKHFNTFIMVHEDYNPCEVLSMVEGMIQNSACIVVFSSFLQVLAELKEYLSDKKIAVCIRVEELWTREYQVLPMRTHPHMNMHGASGYVLSAIKIA